jgi:hypothetical protein
MDSLFSLLGYVGFGFLGLVLLLLVITLLFGRRVSKRWEFEAEFRDMSEREFGEFDIELTRVEKEDTEYSFKASFRMRHACGTSHWRRGSVSRSTWTTRLSCAAKSKRQAVFFCVKKQS